MVLWLRLGIHRWRGRTSGFEREILGIIGWHFDGWRVWNKRILD